MLEQKLVATANLKKTTIEQELWFKYGKQLLQDHPEKNNYRLYPLAFAECLLTHYIPNITLALEKETVQESVYLQRLYQLSSSYARDIHPVIHEHINDALFEMRVSHAMQPLLLSTETPQQKSLALQGSMFIAEILGWDAN